MTLDSLILSYLEDLAQAAAVGESRPASARATIVDVPLSIEDPKIERLARDLAARQGRSVTEVVSQALEEAWQRETHDEGGAETSALVAKLLRIAEAYRQLPTLDDRSDDEILGYDEHGLPR